MRERLKAMKRNVLHLQRQLQLMERELERMIGDLARSGAQEAEDSAVRELSERVIGYLNQKAGRSFGATAENTMYLIRCRMEEGWAEEDFKKVIDTMVRRWNHDKEWGIYLRPRTLFGEHFEEYLQAANDEQGGIDTGGFEEMMIRRMQEEAFDNV
ncbi:MAG: conserved phage C-terminal domain-containing protein [Clostridia bacterium]|nr:conserved phage C-terminal domain-containing protein [Clostridia bacterium]